MTAAGRGGRNGSAAYAAMRRALLAAVARIPPGQVVEIAVLAAALNIPARHAAYILSCLTGDETELVPRHRVVPAGGDLGRPSRWTPRTCQHVALLRAEGHDVSPEGRLRLDPRRLHRLDDRHRATIWAEVDTASGLARPPCT